ncbi:unnamed protein product, partial [Scytosiphon promiscuus]
SIRFAGAAYAACKAAINRLTINWGCEWAKDGIRVNAVAPGATNTPSTASVSRCRLKRVSVKPVLTNHAVKADACCERGGRANPADRFCPDLNDRIPMGRWADPDEISGQVAFFC